ncbi:hypothetical protein [Sporosarcina sp. P13]|nr:hypothetical protein [Sporosarcina sp. P13]
MKSKEVKVRKATPDNDSNVVFPGKLPKSEYDVYLYGEKVGKVVVADTYE